MNPIKKVFHKQKEKRFNRALKDHRKQLSLEINNLLDATVCYGPFKGLKLASDIWWGKGDRASMLLGLYEKELLQKIVDVPRSFNQFLDIGAADGYYAVGVLVSGIFERSVCFEISEKGRSVIQKNALLNSVDQKIQIFEKADDFFYQKLPEDLLKNTLVLIDIEGAEFNLLSDNALNALKNNIIIVELHTAHPFSETDADNLKTRAAKYFNISEFTTGARDLSPYPFLKDYSDTDRWLI
ncbi:MAG: FkbM family methyltransferase, partial [Methylophaga sp.]|nr:FkbM family methyltransferase [Methylophaga sp.]